MERLADPLFRLGYCDSIELGSRVLGHLDDENGPTNLQNWCAIVDRCEQ
jgi:hypothetical protein